MTYSMVGICKVTLAALFNMLANICCFDQKYQPGKITLQDSVLIMKSLVAVSFGECNMFCVFGLNCCLHQFRKQGR